MFLENYSVRERDMLVPINMLTTLHEDESQEASSDQRVSRCPLRARWNIAGRIVPLMQDLCAGTSGIINEYKICDASMTISISAPHH